MAMSLDLSPVCPSTFFLGLGNQTLTIVENKAAALDSVVKECKEEGSRKLMDLIWEQAAPHLQTSEDVEEEAQAEDEELAEEVEVVDKQNTTRTQQA